MKLKTFLSYIQDNVEIRTTTKSVVDTDSPSGTGRKTRKQYLCFKDVKGTIFYASAISRKDEHTVVLSVKRKKPNFHCGLLRDRLVGCMSGNRNPEIRVEITDSDQTYSVKGQCIILEDGSVCFHIYEDEEKKQDSIIQQALKDQYKYSKEYHDNKDKLDNTIEKFASRLGIKTVYMILWLYYAMSFVSASSKAMIWGALGYLISPIDLISDLIPFLGLTDDIAVIAAVFASVSVALSEVDAESVSNKAKNKLRTIFPNFKESDLK